LAARATRAVLADGRALDGWTIKTSLIAATDFVHGLTVATRNRSDFEKAGVKVIDPFHSTRVSGRAQQWARGSNSPAPPFSPVNAIAAL
jgi:hypothetical protein